MFRFLLKTGLFLKKALFFMFLGYEIKKQPLF